MHNNVNLVHIRNDPQQKCFCHPIYCLLLISIPLGSLLPTSDSGSARPDTRKGISLARDQYVVGFGQQGTRTSSSADFMAMGMQTRKTPNMAMAVFRRQCTGRQQGPPVMLHTFCRKSPPPWPCPPWSPPIAAAAAAACAARIQSDRDGMRVWYCGAVLSLTGNWNWGLCCGLVGTLFAQETLLISQITFYNNYFNREVQKKECKENSQNCYCQNSNLILDQTIEAVMTQKSFLFFGKKGYHLWNLVDPDGSSV